MVSGNFELRTSNLELRTLNFKLVTRQQSLSIPLAAKFVGSVSPHAGTSNLHCLRRLPCGAGMRGSMTRQQMKRPVRYDVPHSSHPCHHTTGPVKAQIILQADAAATNLR